MGSNCIIRVDHLSKQYRLGAIGGTTLRAELQRRSAKRHGLEDPNSRIDPRVAAGAGTNPAAGTVPAAGTGAAAGTDPAVGTAAVAPAPQPGDTFLALSDVSFTVAKGERLGILGANGAGKSTLLKIMSSITTPTQGTIELAGRVASMLEVGTGFHRELTGRENIYMNGAILGMTRAEIDAKLEDIIEFSECRAFIDTPVKRYSSGMYVKLAFAVAAHLESEILLMDEVLAVGDVNFQRKCLEKMNDISRQEGRTILYVSHNMATIRALCDRCIVLDQGRLIFDGDVEEAIALYLGTTAQLKTSYAYGDADHHPRATLDYCINSLELLDCQEALIPRGQSLSLRVQGSFTKDVPAMGLRFEVMAGGNLVGSSFMSQLVSGAAGEQRQLDLTLNTAGLVPGRYTVRLCPYAVNEYGQYQSFDRIDPAFVFQIFEPQEDAMKWSTQAWGYVQLADAQLASGGNAIQS